MHFPKIGRREATALNFRLTDSRAANSADLLLITASVPNRLRILHADDDDDDVHFIHKAFEHAGLNPVHRSPDGEDALNYLQGTGQYSDRKRYPYPDLLLMDLKMPRVNGFEVMEWLNSHAHFRLPVIILTGSVIDCDVKRAYALGASCYIAKTAATDELENIASAIKLLWHIDALPRNH